LDLVEVSPAETPPVCRIIDYGKHIYERKKRQKMSAQAHTATIKEIRLRPKTDNHDREIKLKRARGFLEEGHKVQFTMLFRGRERFFKERANSIFHGIVEEFGESVKVERPPLVDGRRMTMVIAPVKKKTGGQAQGGGSSNAPKTPAPKPVTPQPAASPRDTAEPAPPPAPGA